MKRSAATTPAAPIEAAGHQYRALGRTRRGEREDTLMDQTISRRNALRTGGLAAIAAGLLGTVIGLVLLGIALFRSRAVPRWIPVALWLFIFTEFVLTNFSDWASPAAALLYVAALTGIAVQLVRSDASVRQPGDELVPATPLPR